MKTAPILLLFACAAFLPVKGTAQSPDVAKMSGRWSGTATFFDKDLAKRVGNLPFSADFSADGSGTGRIGDATFKVLRVQPARGLVEVRTALTGAMAPDRALAKDYLVLLVTAVSDSSMQAEFHLKSNLTYDARMREGRVTLARVRTSP